MRKLFDYTSNNTAAWPVCIPYIICFLNASGLSCHQSTLDIPKIKYSIAQNRSKPLLANTILLSAKNTERKQLWIFFV